MTATIYTVDSAGRIVIPSAVRRAAGLEPGVPLRISVRDRAVVIEVAPRDITVKEEQGLIVAHAAGAEHTLTADIVSDTIEALRDHREQDDA